MKPVSSNIKPNNKCLNPVTTKCVTWDGPEIVCLDGTVLCKGQSVETTLYAIATKLCQVINELNLEGINPCINNINDDTSVNITQNSTLQEVFSAIIQKVCSLTDRVEVLEGEECSVPKVIVPATSCFRANAETQPDWNATDETLPATTFAELVATTVCAMLIDLTALNSSVAVINQQIQDLWFALQNCANNCDNLVLPTCTYDFTLNPDGEPVSVQTAYSWLEADYCSLKAAVGSPDDIVIAVSKQCPNLQFLDRLSSGGQMGDIAGWVDNPVTLSDSIGNLWLTVCDMRSAVKSILDGCCFSICNYLEFGYDLVWDPAGNYADVVFNDNPGLVYVSSQTPPAFPDYNPSPGVPLPAAVTTQFPTAPQTNVIITVSDGSLVATLNTGAPINTWAVTSNGTNNGYRIDFSTIVGYDKTSTNQTINIYFTYEVDGETCTIDQTDGLVYECCAPKPYPCDIAVTPTSDTNGAGLEVLISGLLQDAPILANSTITGFTGTSITDATQDFSALGVTSGVSGGSVVYINYNSVTDTYDQCRYVTSISGGSNQTLNVDSAWSPALTGTETYVVKDEFYDNYINNACAYNAIGPVTYLQGFVVKVIEVTPTFDPDDENTWSIITQNNNVPWATITNSPGFVVPNGYIDANKEFVVAISANYTCGQSDYVIPGVTTPILGSVSIQLGTQSNPASGLFQNNLSVSVSNILSNGTSLPGQSASLTGPAQFALDLPVAPNTTEFRVIPGIAGWANNTGVFPKPFCYCGINIDPFGFTPSSPPVAKRDLVLGLYRGYDVRVLYNDQINNTILPVLDQSLPPVPYVTDSISDPTLQFSTNTPTIAGGGITIDVPNTYANSTYPVIVRYDPSPYKVDTSPDYHTITLSSVSISFFNTTGGGTPYTFEAWVDFTVVTYNNTLGQYQDYSPARSYTFSTGPQVVPDPGTAGPFTLPVGPLPTLLCRYGDALYAQVRIDYPSPSGFNQIAYDIDLVPSATAPITYSCLGQSEQEQNSNYPSYNNLGGIATNPQGQRYVPIRALITEDFDISFVVTAGTT
jgi:hypothetical protein